MNSLEQALNQNRQSNIARFKTRSQPPTPFQRLYFESLCIEDEDAIRRCFEGVIGDPLDEVKTWRQ